MSSKKSFQHGVRFDQDTEHMAKALCRVDQRNFNNLVTMLIVKEFDRRAEAGEVKPIELEEKEALQQG